MLVLTFPAANHACAGLRPNMHVVPVLRGGFVSRCTNLKPRLFQPVRLSLCVCVFLSLSLSAFRGSVYLLSSRKQGRSHTRISCRHIFSPRLLGIEAIQV